MFMFSKGYIRKMALIAVSVVSWTLLFRDSYNETPTESKRREVFYSEKEARIFYEHRPEPGLVFECVNSLTSKRGYCEVKDVKIKEYGWDKKGEK